MAITLGQLRTRVDDWLTDKWPTFVSRQETYLQNNGTYWQGLWTHSNLPVHASADIEDQDTVPDLAANSPTDQASSWEDEYPALSLLTFPCALKVDVYRDDNGHGWQATLWVEFDGVIYERSQGVGYLAASRNHDWQVYTEP